jgi:sugar fermentation stimulation protein A
MQFQKALVGGTLIRRYKRFLADVELAAGEQTTVHCPDSGAMLGCCEPGSRVWMSRSDNPKRKYPLTWELVELPGGVLASINAGQSNRLIEEAIEQGELGDLGAYEQIRREPRVTDGRLDFLLSANGRRDCYLEVKSVTAAAQGSMAMFPDAVSVRAHRHLEQLMLLKRAGHRSVLLFCVKRSDMRSVRPATEIDPVYTEVLKDAIAAGVEVVAWGCQISTTAITLKDRLPFQITG